MKWKKVGNIFSPNSNYSWMKSHAANTVAEHLYEDVFRIYFSCRNENNVSSIGFFDIDIYSPTKILNICDVPILSPGDVGLFDDSGVSLSCINNINGKKYLYYVGWNLGVTVPWRNSIGVAIYDESKNSFQKIGVAPIIDRCNIDPFSVSYPYIIEDDGVFKMWYGSNLSWGKSGADMIHIIKYAESRDGVNWSKKGAVKLDFKNEDEYAISRPCVIKESGIYKMWYSYRGDTYRIGYAESLDGIYWCRKDEEVGIDVSISGWDSEMIEYPFIFDHKGQRFMLYNGNGYGKTGVGLAILID